MSFLHLYAAQGGSGAYLSQPALTGRFLISSHCQLEHLRRLLPRWPEMCGRLRWKDVERRWKGWREWKGQGWKKDSDEGEEKRYRTSTWCWYHQLFLPLLFSDFPYVQYQSWSAWPNELLRNKRQSKYWKYSPLIMEILAIREVNSRQGQSGNLQVLQLDQQSLVVLSWIQWKAEWKNKHFSIWFSRGNVWNFVSGP